MMSLAVLMEKESELRAQSTDSQGNFAPRPKLPLRHWERPLVIHDELQPAQAELRGHHVEIDRKTPEVQREMRIEALEKRQQRRGHRVEHGDGREVAGERVAFARIGAEVHEVIPEEKKRRAH